MTSTTNHAHEATEALADADDAYHDAIRRLGPVTADRARLDMEYSIGVAQAQAALELAAQVRAGNLLAVQRDGMTNPALAERIAGDAAAVLYP